VSVNVQIVNDDNALYVTIVVVFCSVFVLRSKDSIHMKRSVTCSLEELHRIAEFMYRLEKILTLFLIHISQSVSLRTT